MPRQSTKCQDLPTTTTTASSASNSNNNSSNTTTTTTTTTIKPVNMTLIAADLKQQRTIKDEIYSHFECDKDVADQDDRSLVANFYKGRNVFITGASGFVGKCLLEKLLRSCPSIKNVYILLRPKRGLGIEERLAVLLQSELFGRLRKCPNADELIKKIKPIKGDITLPLFGLTEEDIELISSQVSIIFHSAATVKFVEPLKVAVTNNLVSVGNLVELGSKMKSLEALVHVSTAYSNCDRESVDEIFYEPPIEPEKLIEMAHWMDSEMFERIAPALIGRRPNSYTFTKAVGEALLAKRSKELIPSVPIAVVRPSIVAATWQQPMKGWVDNFNGPTGAILSMATGALQAMPALSNYRADIVPVDIVANLIICSAYHVKTNQLEDEGGEKEQQKISIFNCTSGTLNPICWHDIVESVKIMCKQYPVNNSFRDPGFILMSNDYLFKIFNFFSHKCVAYFGDFCLQLIGKKPSLVIIYSRLNKMVSTLRPFTTKQWLFKCKKVTSLYENLSSIDQEIFNFDVRQVAWKDYISRYYVGSKTFALKDDPNKLSNARHKWRRLKTSSRAAQLLLLMIAYYFLLSGTSLEQYFLKSIELLLPNGMMQKYASIITGSAAAAAAAASSSSLPYVEENNGIRI